MNTEAAKAERERLVFEAFIKKSGLQINPESIQQPKGRSKPDIVCYCQKKEGKVAFELVEICDENLGRKISAIRGSGGVEYVRSRDPSWEVLRKKLKKRYQTEYPVELLCYVSGRTISPDIVILDRIRPMIDMDNGQFRRVWLLGDQCHLVWPVS